MTGICQFVPKRPQTPGIRFLIPVRLGAGLRHNRSLWPSVPLCCDTTGGKVKQPGGKIGGRLIAKRHPPADSKLEGDCPSASACQEATLPLHDHWGLKVCVSSILSIL